MPVEPASRRYSAPALDKGLDILEHLAGERLPLSQLEISQALDRTPGEINRMLACLEERGYVVREEGSGKFRLSLRLYQLAHQQNATALLRNAARVPMETLAEATGQACHLSVQHGNSVLVMMERMPARRICLAVGEGTLLPLLHTTSGRMLLSRLGREELDRLLAQHPDFPALSAPARKTLLRTVAEIRGQPLSTSTSDVSDAIADIAVPIGVAGTETSAILAISHLVMGKTGGPEAKRYRRAMLDCARLIDRNLGII